MKKLSLLLLVPSLSYASFSKPELIARMNAENAWNVPDNFWCFTGEPVIQDGAIYLGCMDYESGVMARWNKEGFSVLARPVDDNFFTGLTASFGKVSWAESDQFSVKRSYVSTDVVSSRDIKIIGPLSEAQDSFLPYTSDSFFFKSRGDSPQLWIWKNETVTSFFNPDAAYIFTPQPGTQGEIAFKARSNDLMESSPDRLWHYNGNWRVILEDKDADPASVWKSFRNQLSVDGDNVVVIASDGKSEALLLISNGTVDVLARTGKELAKFDYFTPKMRAGTIVVRGEDFSGNKVTYVKDNGPFRPLISQGDIVHTDLGPGRVHYQNQDSIFYGAAGIDEKGSVVLQATLTDADHPRTLLGIGLIKFNKE